MNAALPSASLLLSALLWVGLHVGVAGTRLRGALVARTGENGFRIAYSLASVASIAWLVASWGPSPTAPLWTASQELRWALVALMLPAFVLFAGSVLTPNATAVGGDRLLAAEPRGMLRITRHPMLWSFAIWSAVHVAGNGDSAAAVFFGAFGLTALLGMPSLDAKLAAREPAGWAAFAARTSVVPFAAALAGRNRPRWGELWLPLAVGAAAWAALLLLHPSLFGVWPVMPPWGP